MVRRFSVLMLILLAFAAMAAAKTGPRKKSHKAKAAVVQPAPEPARAPAPAPPPPPLTPEQGPSYPPDVSFQGGQLTIVARNSTMGDVLTAVKQRTGAAVEMPPVSSERVVGKFGPGAARDVMAQLLNGSHYDYVLVGSPADPGSLKKVVLMARINGPEAPQPQPNQTVQPGNLQAVPDIASDDQQPDDNGTVETPEAQEQPEQEEPQPEQPQQPGPNGPAVKTPEQLLRELQQQQQQQQQQQNGAPPGAPPQ